MYNLLLLWLVFVVDDLLKCHKSDSYWHRSHQHCLVNLLLYAGCWQFGVCCIVEIFPPGQTQRDCLLVKGQCLHRSLVVHLVCGCTVNRNMHRGVTVSLIRVFFAFWHWPIPVLESLPLGGCAQVEYEKQISQVIMLKGSWSLECKCMSEHYAMRCFGWQYPPYTLYLLFVGLSRWCVCLDRVYIRLNNCNMEHFTTCLIYSISMSFLRKSFITIGRRLYPSQLFTLWQASFPPFPALLNRK